MAWILYTAVALSSIRLAIPSTQQQTISATVGGNATFHIPKECVGAPNEYTINTVRVQNNETQRLCVFSQFHQVAIAERAIVKKGDLYLQCTLSDIQSSDNGVYATREASNQADFLQSECYIEYTLFVQDITSSSINYTPSTSPKSKESSTDAMTVPEVTTSKSILCPASMDGRGRMWNSSIVNYTTVLPCAKGYKGNISRYCDTNGGYRSAIYNCIFDVIYDLNKTLNSNQTLNSTATLKELSNVVHSDVPLYEGDLLVIENLLNTIAENFTASKEGTRDFYNILDNLIDNDDSLSWGSLLETTGHGAESILQSADVANEKIMEALMKGTLKDNVTLDGENLYLIVKLADEENKNVVDFPGKGRPLPPWATPDMASISIPFLPGSPRVAYTGILYRNVSQLLSSNTAGTSSKNGTGDAVINSAVISFSLPEAHARKLKPPVTISLKKLNRTDGKSACSFFNFTTKRWESDGCWEDSANTTSDVIVCKCNHLTNFALLVSPVGMDHVTAEHSRALSILTMCGITVSSICLLANIVLYIIFWRTIFSEAAIIIISICINLFIANIVFIFGVSQTSNADVCTAIAVILHYAYLAFFLLLLADGINLLINVILPMNKRRWGRLMCCLAYVLAGIIVGISAGAYRLEGYGNENFCWLGHQSGQIWTFIGPALAVIVVNICLIIIVMYKLLGIAAFKTKSSTDRFQAAAKALGAMVSITGVTWLFGFLSVNKDTIVFQYLFVICNSFQGVLIFIFHGILNKKLQHRIREKFGTVSSSLDTYTNKRSDQSTSVL